MTTYYTVFAEQISWTCLYRPHMNWGISWNLYQIFQALSDRWNILTQCIFCLHLSFFFPFFMNHHKVYVEGWGLHLQYFLVVQPLLYLHLLIFFMVILNLQLLSFQILDSTIVTGLCSHKVTWLLLPLIILQQKCCKIKSKVNIGTIKWELILECRLINLGC